MASVGVPDLPGVAARNRHDWISVFGRIGLVAKGVSYALVGLLALEVALGQGGRATSRQGALATIAGHSSGKVLLVTLAIGFAAYALWRLAETIWPGTTASGSSRWPAAPSSPASTTPTEA